MSTLVERPGRGHKARAVMTQLQKTDSYPVRACMSNMKDLAGFVVQTTFDDLPSQTREIAQMHILDAIASMLSGPHTLEGLSLGKLVSRFGGPGDLPVIGYPFKSTLPTAIIAECAATRCTEMDDFHLESLVTPGSVVVPTALSLAASGHLRDPRDFLPAVTVGYQLMIMLGIAIDGPRALYKGTWPTYLAAAFGSAAVTAKSLRLDGPQAASALSTSLALSAGARIGVQRGISSRCLMLGIAAQNGLIAGFSAEEGFVGDETLLYKSFGQSHGIEVDTGKLNGGLADGFHIDRASMKPFPVAGQALSAIEAFREISRTHSIAPESIGKITVSVPKRFAAMIDRASMPENHLDSVLSIQYQIALVAFVPDGLRDVKRERLVKDDRIIALMGKIQVEPSDELEAYCSSAFPANVEVQAGGQCHSLELIHPKGAPCNRFGWEDVIGKFRWATEPYLDEKAAEQVIELVQSLSKPDDLSSLLRLLTNISFTTRSGM